MDQGLPIELWVKIFEEHLVDRAGLLRCVSSWIKDITDSSRIAQKRETNLSVIKESLSLAEYFERWYTIDSNVKQIAMLHHKDWMNSNKLFHNPLTIVTVHHLINIAEMGTRLDVIKEFAKDHRSLIFCPNDKSTWIQFQIYVLFCCPHSAIVDWYHDELINDQSLLVDHYPKCFVKNEYINLSLMRKPIQSTCVKTFEKFHLDSLTLSSTQVHLDLEQIESFYQKYRLMMGKPDIKRLFSCFGNPGTTDDSIIHRSIVNHDYVAFESLMDRFVALWNSNNPGSIYYVLSNLLICCIKYQFHVGFKWMRNNYQQISQPFIVYLNSDSEILFQNGPIDYSFMNDLIESGCLNNYSSMESLVVSLLSRKDLNIDWFLTKRQQYPYLMNYQLLFNKESIRCINILFTKIILQKASHLLCNLGDGADRMFESKYNLSSELKQFCDYESIDLDDHLYNKVLYYLAKFFKHDLCIFTYWMYVSKRYIDDPDSDKASKFLIQLIYNQKSNFEISIQISAFSLNIFDSFMILFDDSSPIKYDIQDSSIVKQLLRYHRIHGKSEISFTIVDDVRSRNQGYLPRFSRSYLKFLFKNRYLYQLYPQAESSNLWMLLATSPFDAKESWKCTQYLMKIQYHCTNHYSYKWLCQILLNLDKIGHYHSFVQSFYHNWGNDGGPCRSCLFFQNPDLTISFLHGTTFDHDGKSPFQVASCLSTKK